MATSSYKNGLRDGRWTPELVRQLGFRSVQECLVHQEQVYQEEMNNLLSLRLRNPTYAASHAEYMEGWIVGVRQSLQSMM